MGKDKKQCNKCNETKERELFPKSPWGDGRGAQCNACRRQYKRDNREKIQKQRAKYREENREVLREKHRQWLAEHGREYRARPEVRERYRITHAEWMRNKKKEDPAYKLQAVVSRAVWGALNGREKNSRTFDALPYTPEQLKEHLESQFEDWMNWDNYGEWHVDHIHPQSLLPYDSMDHPNFQKCWALENLQPLEARENIIKSNKILDRS